MGAPREEHGGLPAGLVPHCLVRHPARRCPCLQTLVDCPPHAAAPDPRPARGTGRRLAERVGRGRRGAARPFAHPPDRTLREPLLTYEHAVTRNGIRHRPLGPVRAGPPLPLPGRQGRGPSRDALRGAGGRTPGALRSFCALIPLDLRLGGRPLRPPTRLSGEGPQSRGPPPRLKHRQQIGASARHASGHHVPAGQYACRSDALPPCRRPWRLRLPPHLGGPPTLRPSWGLRGGKPDVRQAKPVRDAPLSLPRGLPSHAPSLTVRHLPQRPTRVPRPARSVLALCDKARGSPPQDATALDSARHRLHGWPGQGAVRPDQVIYKRRPGCTPRNTIMPAPLQRLSLVHEAFASAALSVKGGHHARRTGSAATREHRRSPGARGSSRSSRESRAYEVKNKRRCRDKYVHNI
jgi:hypothetical protein